MPETPPVGTPVHAIVLEPLDETFPAAGEVVILKRIGNSRIPVRSRHLYKNQPATEEFDEIQLAKLRIVPDTDKSRTSDNSRRAARLSCSVNKHSHKGYFRTNYVG